VALGLTRKAVDQGPDEESTNGWDADNVSGAKKPQGTPAPGKGESGDDVNEPAKDKGAKASPYTDNQGRS
jgi:hypothetical protein